MKNKIIYCLLVIFFIFVFVIFYKGLNNSNIYTPKTYFKSIPEFSAQTFFEKKTLSSQDIFYDNKFYLLNIWASWCKPCKDEHPLLINLSMNKKIKIIGLNYKDNFNKAEKFIKKLGNPYSIIILDRDGTKAIEWGAFGVPETFLIHENKIIKRFIGPLNSKLINEIENYIK
ncbi:DsbE family thiol:disulfide interchange protein [Candidatus Pelagibacter sp.]|jgi:cytochrome c biogenesis protein CcmG, thiol:disulfide interchange protein DsbE|nr:DsbE family thiol:disulfide interchange protein [Candidatus Pelagibacter sp.]